MLIAEDICERWLALCRYAEYRHRSSYPGELSRLSSLQSGQSLKYGHARQDPAVSAFRLDRILGTYTTFNARRSYASAVLGVLILFVSPSVRLSVCQTRAL